MIYEVSGDILLSKAQVLAHGVAPMDPMNQGLALSLHQKFPTMHKEFHHWCSHNHPKPGEAWLWTAPNGARIVNLLSQEGGHGHGFQPGKATIKYVRDSLRALAKLLAAQSCTSVALPRVATGVGGLEWKDVRPVIEERLGDLQIPVIVYSEYRPGEKAKEPKL